MSTFYKITKHPISGHWEDACWYDDLLGHHHYGVVFPSDCPEGDIRNAVAKKVAWDPRQTELETRERDEGHEPTFDADDLEWDPATMKAEYAVVFKDAPMPLWRRILLRIPFVRRYVTSHLIATFDFRDDKDKEQL